MTASSGACTRKPASARTANSPNRVTAPHPAVTAIAIASQTEVLRHASAFEGGHLVRLRAFAESQLAPSHRLRPKTPTKKKSPGESSRATALPMLPRTPASGSYSERKYH